MSIEMSVTGKTIIVTGIASGIGRTVGERLLSGGARVLGLDIVPLPVSWHSQQDASTFAFMQIDLTSPCAGEQAVDMALQSFPSQPPRIDGLANVAGVMDNMASVDTLDDEIYERVMAVNLTAPLRLMRAVVRQMKKQDTALREHIVGQDAARGGSIVNMGSQSSASGALAGIAYTTSKHALVGASKNVAFRFRNERIRCNGVLPGSVPTGIYKLPEPVDREAMELFGVANNVHLDNKIPANDVAEMVTFLLSDASKHISGAMIPVDQAWCAV